MSKNLSSIMSVIVANPELHARWLNTFSYLEYIGFRKIVKSQNAQDLNVEVLSHAVEEGRHALLLKRLAIKTGGLQFNTYSPDMLLCGSEAEKYFQGLDRACESLIEDKGILNKSRLTYLYVTWLIEVRALLVYESYQKTIGMGGTKSPLSSLLAEEERHLASVGKELQDSDPCFEAHSAELKVIEEKLYQNYLMALRREVLGREVSVGATY
jgi:hypothetical protein